MAEKRSRGGLGRDLYDIFGDNDSSASKEAGAEKIKITSISPRKDQPRKTFEKEALELLAKINAGEITFEAAAAAYSSCPSGQNGGNLGDFGQGQMVPEFDAAVFAMEVGEISSAPVKTQFGYHLIKLIAKNDAAEIPLAEIAGEIKEALLSEKRRTAYEKKINQLKILYPVDIL